MANALPIRIRLGTAVLLAAAITANAPPLSAQAPAPGKPPVWTEAQLASATTFARALEAALIAEDVEPCLAAFDKEAIVAGGTEGLEVSRTVLEGIRSGIRDGIDRALQQVVAEWRGSMPKFKRVLVLEGRPYARFRFSGEGGLSIIDLSLVPRGDGWAISDINNHALGLRMVDQMRQTILLMMEGADTGLLARLFGSSKVGKDDADNIKALFRAKSQGDHAAALAAHAKLSPAVRDSAGIMAAQVACLAAAGDDDAYIAALERAAQKHPAPMFRFTLVDAHFLRQQWDAAVACIDECMAAIERDAALLALRAMILLQAGKLADAQKDLAEALQLEPDCEFALTAGIDVWLAAKNWTAVRDAIVALEKTGKYDFHGALDDEIWADFKRAPESEPWR